MAKLYTETVQGNDRGSILAEMDPMTTLYAGSCILTGIMISETAEEGFLPTVR